jgi:TRAP-type transport system periplasmic protein
MARTRLIASALAAIVFSATSAAAAKLTFTTHEPADAFVYAGTWKPWAEKVVADSHGALAIDNRPQGFSRDPIEQLSLVISGKADIAFIVLPNYRDRFLDQDVFMQPGLLRNATEASIAATRMEERGQLTGFEGLVPLAVLVAAPSAAHSTYPVRTPEDLVGKRWNTNVGLTIVLFRKLGAEMADTYLTPRAARTLIDHEFDGVVADWVGSNTFGTLEVAHHHLAYPFGGVMLGFVINRSAYDRLPAEARAAIDRHKGVELASSFGRAFDTDRAGIVDQLRSDPAQSIVEPVGPDAEHWRAAFAPIVAEWRSASPRNSQLADALENELKKIRGAR